MVAVYARSLSSFVSMTDPTWYAMWSDSNTLMVNFASSRMMTIGMVQAATRRKTKKELRKKWKERRQQVCCRRVGDDVVDDEDDDDELYSVFEQEEKKKFVGVSGVEGPLILDVVKFS